MRTGTVGASRDQEKAEGHQKFFVDIPVRFKDVDSLGHVNNAVFFTYFEEGRKAFFYHLFDILEPSRYEFILASVNCEYRKPVKLNDVIRLHLWVGKTGKKSFTLNYRVVNRERPSVVFATGESVQVWYDYREERTVPLPAEFLAGISGFVEGNRAA